MRRFPLERGHPLADRLLDALDLEQAEALADWLDEALRLSPVDGDLELLAHHVAGLAGASRGRAELLRDEARPQRRTVIPWRPRPLEPA